MAEADWSIITDLTAEVVEVLEKMKRRDDHCQIVRQKKDKLTLTQRKYR